MCFLRPVRHSSKLLRLKGGCENPKFSQLPLGLKWERSWGPSLQLVRTEVKQGTPAGVHCRITVFLAGGNTLPRPRRSQWERLSVSLVCPLRTQAHSSLTILDFKGFQGTPASSSLGRTASTPGPCHMPGARGHGRNMNQLPEALNFH